MDIGLSTEILVVGFVFATAWLFLSRLWLPALRRKLSESEAEEMPTLAGRLNGAGVLRDIALSGFIAFLLVLLSLVALNIYVVGVPEDEAGLVGLMDLRQQADLAVDRFQEASVTAWAVAMAILALIWLSVSRSRARRSWDDAIDARRTALTSRTSDMDLAMLRVAAEEAEPGMPSRLDARIASLIERGQNSLREALDAKALRVGKEDAALVSLNELSLFRDELGAMAASAPSESVDDDQDMGEAADALDAQIRRLKSEIMIDLQGLTGPTRMSLATAETALEANLAPEGSRRRELAETYVHKTLANHVAEGRARVGAEPESLREWVVAGSTSETVTRATGRVGQVARYSAIVAFFLGFVGIGTAALGPGMTASLMDAELGLASQISADSVATASAQFEPSEETLDVDDLASDATTETMLRATMRASFARAVHSGVTARTTVATLTPRQHFDLASISARQQVLAASARRYTAAADGAPAIASYTVRGVQASGDLPVDSVLNPLIDQRIAQLRANESVWTSLRASAARPASPDLAAEQFLRVAFTDNATIRSHHVRMLASQVMADVARTAARSGAIPYGYTPDIQGDVWVKSLSARDQRILIDFESGSAGRATQYVDEVRLGYIDPGSLHRVAPGGAVRAGGASSAYGDLFPAALDVASLGGGSDDGRVGGSRVESKSYRSVRFNRRVGGVVIGRGPEVVETVDIIGFDWEVRSDRMRIALVDRSGLLHDLGLFDPAIAHHALAYAADGRVVTSTLPAVATDEAPLEVPTRRVVVHPAFEDTEFACAAIQIDRFVDTVMSGGSATQETALLLGVRNAVTGFARILQYAGPAESTPVIVDQLGVELQAAFDYAKSCGIGEECFPMASYAGYGLDFGKVDTLLTCFKDSAAPADCTGHLTGLYSETTYSVDSGVRESAYDIDPSLDFLTGRGSAKDPLWPLDFIVQAVPQSTTEESLDISEDWEPWTFPATADTLRFLIAKEVSANAGARAVFEDMREFVLLQRLFRAALEGHLGLDFPFHALIDMQLATSEYVVVERQEHWNLNNELGPFLMEQTDSLKQDMEQELALGTKAEECRAAMKSALDLPEESNWPKGPGIWSGLDEVELACNLSPFDGLGQRIAALREMDLVDEALFLSATLDRPRAPLSCN
jgi:hypothetical protein